jgi:hypothetical protein
VSLVWGITIVRKIIVRRLFQSFVELEKAISTAKKTLLSQKEPQQHVLDRIKTYEEILEKQRELATAMCGHAALGNWEEVARHVKLINGLSFMIRDDARDILAKARPQKTEEVREVMYC